MRLRASNGDTIHNDSNETSFEEILLLGTLNKRNLAVFGNVEVCHSPLGMLVFHYTNVFFAFRVYFIRISRLKFAKS